ncbi:hypothetical protein ACVWZA_000599 [Sphingomonas sp. UYAg733]
MRDTLLATALLGASAGLSAGLSPVGSIRLCLLALATSAATAICLHGVATDRMLIPGWTAIAIGAGTTWLPARIRRPALMPLLAGLCGAIAGSLPSNSTTTSIMIFALGLTLATTASAMLFARGWLLPTRVVASWLVAIAALNVTLTVLPVTPGYMPDHLD